MNSPKKITFIVALALGVLGVVGSFVSVPIISGITFWLLVAGWLLLVLGCVVKGL